MATNVDVSCQEECFSFSKQHQGSNFCDQRWILRCTIQTKNSFVFLQKKKRRRFRWRQGFVCNPAADSSFKSNQPSVPPPPVRGFKWRIPCTLSFDVPNFHCILCLHLKENGTTRCIWTSKDDVGSLSWPRKARGSSVETTKASNRNRVLDTPWKKHGTKLVFWNERRCVGRRGRMQNEHPSMCVSFYVASVPPSIPSKMRWTKTFICCTSSTTVFHENLSWMDGSRDVLGVCGVKDGLYRMDHRCRKKTRPVVWKQRHATTRPTRGLIRFTLESDSIRRGSIFTRSSFRRISCLPTRVLRDGFFST